MKDVFEIRIHGRGGQGAKSAAEFLAGPPLESGLYIQSFPEYGPERGGAPIKAFTRISAKKINIHSGVTNPDLVAVIDPTLMDSIPVTEGMDNEGILVINTPDSPEQIKKRFNFKGCVYTVDATSIAIKHMGRNIPNTPMLGAIIKAMECLKKLRSDDPDKDFLKNSPDQITKFIKHKFERKLGKEETKKNIDAVKQAYLEVRSVC
ncbi:MAG: 2-oxoacid:acceptor oxidoreductase family protein [Candidatus Aenigmarchaeota archaeon]|nr:2-oxoacid:acceptor oxidoreductase family protein [Candidatus Aenigmarchaeota archaeon]